MAARPFFGKSLKSRASFLGRGVRAQLNPDGVVETFLSERY
jgi:hypothetical protein